MKVFTKKRVLLMLALTLLVVAAVAIALPTVAAEPEQFYGVNVSTSGNVSLNFFYTSLGEADSVCVIERNSKGDLLSKQSVDVDSLPVENGRYVVSVQLAAAEMTNYVTVYTEKNGVKLGESHTYSVKQYADEVLAKEDYSEYHAAVRAMLNYGAMAQAHFGVNSESLANDSIYRGGTNPINAVTDIDCTAPSWTDGTTLTFKGYEAVLDTKTAFRVYFAYSGSASPGATVEREGLAATYTSVYFDSSRGLYYVRINNIAATLYDKQYTVKVTDGSDSLTVTASVLNYADYQDSDYAAYGEAFLANLLNNSKWHNDVAKCECDYTILMENGREIFYHSESGTFIDYDFNKSLTVSEENRVKLNACFVDSICRSEVHFFDENNRCTACGYELSE